jgi:hypothetical protein
MPTLNQWRAALPQVRLLLESLPLSTGEFGLAMNRLKSAGRYLRLGEPGAAKFELRLLARWLTNDSTRTRH